MKDPARPCIFIALGTASIRPGSVVSQKLLIREIKIILDPKHIQNDPEPSNETIERP